MGISSEEIKATRNRYGLSQRSFARILGIGDASIARYENGQEPSAAIANLIRAAANPSFMMECFERCEEQLPNPEGIQKIIYSEIKLDKSGKVRSMNEIYELTLCQEVLDEKAAQILGEITNLRAKAKQAGDELADAAYKDLAIELWRAKDSIPLSENLTDLAAAQGAIDCIAHLCRTFESRVAA